MPRRCCLDVWNCWFRGAKPGRFESPPARLGSGIGPRMHHFSSLPSGQQNSENCPQLKADLCGKCFCNTFLSVRKTSAQSPRPTDFDFRVDTKSDVEESPNKKRNFEVRYPKNSPQPQATQATGPPTQATGPPRSGAGVGVGMLRGAGDSLFENKK